MSVPSWPAGLPRFTVAGYSRRPQQRGIRFEPELGPAKQRARTRAAPWRWQLRLELTGAEKDIFWTFWGTTLSGGAREFTMADPFSGASGRWRFIVGAEPQETIEAPYFVISFELERLA